MEHYLSIATQKGQFSTTMVKAPLGQVLKESRSKAPEKKEDCWLVSNGYSDREPKYARAERNFEWIDTILLDVDNPQCDPTLLDEFRREYGRYCHFLWETASSSIERPKFRAILLLDRKIPWINEPQKFTKKAIHQAFGKWTDDNASWFFTPTKSKLSTFAVHPGKPYPSAEITDLVNLNMAMHEALKPSTASMWDDANMSMRRHSSNGWPYLDRWRNLPSVKYCLEGGLRKGERDDSINKACYAMRENGYASDISTFLDEIIVADEFKRKFRYKYLRK